MGKTAPSGEEREESECVSRDRFEAGRSMAVNSGARLWGAYKELYNTVQNAVLRHQQDAIHDLDVALRKHKPDFISLLENPAKNSVHRDAVKKAATEGLTIAGRQGAQTLSPAFIEEALIISDLFNLNEYAAVELLMAGESQLPYFPGLTRGLVAVLLYYDGRASLVNSLRMLIQARSGRTWTLGLSDDLISIATKFTDQLMSEGLTGQILGLIRGMNWVKEEEKLQKDRALGNSKHRKMVSDHFSEIQISLAECLFCWSCQNPLAKADTLQLITYLKGSAELGADGKVDSVTMALLMALLYSIDVRILEQEDFEEIIQKLPVVNDMNFVADIQRDLMSPTKWKNAGLQAVVNLAWALTLRAVSQYPNIQGVSDLCEQDELLADGAVEADVFFFLEDAIINTTTFHKEEFYVRQVHNIIVDFIVQMPLKVKELRNRGDETARLIMSYEQEGLEPPRTLKRHFEHLLSLVGSLYGEDPLGLELALEYWCPPEPPVTAAASFTAYRPQQRQISLYKFLRHSGDLLPPSLYIPYIGMLTGLANGPQCAHHAFNLLKLNSGQTSTVSWDHFFGSMNQYYTSLRQESSPPSDMAHLYRHHVRGVTPHEVEGLIAVLKLIRVIAIQDESARISLVDNQHWMVVVVILGLVSCSLPPKLKAELLLSLSALAKTPEIASSIWQSLEVSQMVPTVPSSSVLPTGGLPVELDEVESRNEEYPMTLAFLDLLNTLTDVPVPPALGAGFRAPGFDPYLDFLRDAILLKFNTRAYKDPAQRWEVGAAVLEILEKLLSSHVVSVEDFFDHPVEVQGGGSAVANKPPGHTLLIHMLNDSPLLKMVLYILDEGTKRLEEHVVLEGRSHLERATLACLKMVEGTLAQQEPMLAALRESGSSVMVSSLDRLLLGINPRTSRPDHTVNVARYVTYNATLPEHALVAVKVLWWVCQSPLTQSELVGLFTSTEQEGVDLLHGFVECLETDEAEEAEKPTPDGEESAAQIRNSTRQTIVRMLLSSIDQPSPNLAHFLLGFDLRKPVSKTNLEDPGVRGSPRTCLHSLLTLLDKDVGSPMGPVALRHTPRLAGLTYRLLYVLCANKDTSGPTMRYLRSAHDFLFRHIQHLPFQQDGGADNALGPQSWLLKAAAVELRLTAINRQRSHTQRLLHLLLDDHPASHNKVLRADGTYEPDYTQYEAEVSSFSMCQGLSQTVSGGQSRRKILQILDSISLEQSVPRGLECKYFEAENIEHVVASCEMRSDIGVPICDVKMLYKRLMTELNNCLATTAIGQRDLIVQEISQVCEAIVERNAARTALGVKRVALNAWRQVVEVMLTACPEDLLTEEMRQNVIFELLHDLLLKVSDENALPELCAPVAGVVLTLVCHLRQCFMSEGEAASADPRLSHYLSVLDGAPAANHSAAFDQPSGSRTLFSSSLQVVLKGLIEHILRSSSGLQRVRANLYGALLCYLQIAQKPSRSHTVDTVLGEKSVGILVSMQDTEIERLVNENLTTILSYGTNFMDIVCRDACDGHDVGRMLALGVLDSVLTFDVHQQWLSFMTSKGYIQHIVDSVLTDDEQLRAALRPQPEPLRVLYIYESKMSMLTRVAKSAVGAHTLLQCGLMRRLAECTVFSLRPESHRSEEEQLASFVPPVITRYRQILFPALRLSLAVLTSLGIENVLASNQVLIFLLGHIDVFSAILRERHTSLHPASLQELALTTSVLSRAAVDDSEADIEVGDTARVEYGRQLAQLQQLMLSLLPRFALSDQLMKDIEGLDPSGDTRSEVLLAVEQVAANVVAFCRNIVTKSARGVHDARIFFGPSLVEAVARDGRLDELAGGGMVVSQPASLGVLVFLLRQAASHFHNVMNAHKQSLRKLESVSGLTAEELKELCGAEASEKMSSQERHQRARDKLAAVIVERAQQLHLLSYIIENCVFLLWQHLDFYLLRCVPSDSGTSLFRVHTGNQSQLRRLQDQMGASPRHIDEDPSREVKVTMSQVTRDDLAQLKVDTVACLNDSLFKKLHEIEQVYTKKRTRFGFMEALLRRLKRLVKLHTG